MAANRCSWGWVCIVVVGLALVFPGFSRPRLLPAAAPSAADELETKLAGRIGIQLDNVQAPQAIQRLCEAAGVGFAIDPELFGDSPPRVTLSLEDTRVETALGLLAAQLQMQVYRAEKVLYFSRQPLRDKRFQPLFPDPRPAADRRLLQLLECRTKEVRNGFEVGTPLETALEFIAKRHNIKILIDHVGFEQARGDKNIGQMPISLPPISDVPLSLILDELLAQVEPQGTYLVRSGHVYVTPREKIEGGEHFLAPVTVVAEEQPFTDVCRELSEKTGVTIVIDRRLGGQAKTPVTATIRRAKLLDAVGLLADQVDARAVIRGEVLYVTSPENGRRLQEEAETPRRQAMPGP